jgi:hypothetical protein
MTSDSRKFLCTTVSRRSLFPTGHCEMWNFWD